MSNSNDFDMDFDFEGDDIDKDGKGGGMVAPGAYCFQVTSVTPKTENTGDMLVEMEVVSGTVPTELGKKHYEYVKYPEGRGDPSNPKDPSVVRRQIIRQVFYALKLTTPEELKANPRFRVDLSLAVGRLVCGKIKHEHYQNSAGENKTKAVLFQKGAWDLWAVDSPKAAGIPMPAMAGTGAPIEAPQGSGLGDDLDALIG